MMLALEMAVTAATPSEWLTQKALTVALRFCRAFPPSTGRANTNSVLPIGPSEQIVTGPTPRRGGLGDCRLRHG